MKKAPPPPKLILASSSPRRRELLSGLGLAFEVIKPEISEILQKGETPNKYALRNARIKADWVFERSLKKHDDFIIVAADTIVILKGHILEKPRDQKEAVKMLTSLSSNWHTVVTGVCLMSLRQGKITSHTFNTKSEVFIKKLSPREIKSYVATKEPMDKAGSYAVQGIGGYMVKAINGSYTNVVGLPLTEVIETLEDRFSYRIYS